MRKGEESKKKIIDAAEKLFARKGYANTSVQDVLDELKISKGGFYHYFDTKMELLAEVCRRRAEEWYAAGIAHVRGMRAGAVERLNAALRLMNTLDRESPALLGAMTEVGLAGEDAAVKGQHYKYPHDHPGHWVEQQYLPDALAGTRYYEWGENKTEQAARAYWERIKREAGK